jgi:hypothetical protein
LGLKSKAKFYAFGKDRSFGIQATITLVKISIHQKLTIEIDECHDTIVSYEENFLKIDKRFDPKFSIDAGGFVGGDVQGYVTLNLGLYGVVNADVKKREVVAAIELRGQIYGEFNYSYNVFGVFEDTGEIPFIAWDNDKEGKGIKVKRFLEQKLEF